MSQRNIDLLTDLKLKKLNIKEFHQYLAEELKTRHKEDCSQLVHGKSFPCTCELKIIRYVLQAIDDKEYAV